MRVLEGVLRCSRCRQLTTRYPPPMLSVRCSLRPSNLIYQHRFVHYTAFPALTAHHSFLHVSPSSFRLLISFSSSFHSSALLSDDERKDTTSASSSPSSPQYWRNERIIERIVAEHRPPSSSSSSEKKKKPPLLLRLSSSLQHFLLSVTSTFIDLVQHPSHIRPLLSSFWSSLRSAAHHYWLGSKLLAADVRTAYRLARKTTKGHSLTRREKRQLQRTTADLIRLVPFSIFIVVPFMELLLPVFLKIFPNLLPSTFQDAHKREEQLKRELRARLNVASFLQDTVESMARQREGGRHAESAKQLLTMLKAARQGQRLTTEQLVSVAGLFNDEITLDNLSTVQLAMVCRYLNLPVVGGESMMKYAIEAKMRRLHVDDEMIRAEGMENMSDEELRAACRARGMRDFGLTREGYMRNLQQWMDLSLHKKIPDSLLLLSRAMSISEEPSTEDITAALTSMSEESIDELAAEAGITDNEQRLAILKRQNELIAAEDKKKVMKEKEKKEKQKAKEKAEIKREEGEIKVEGREEEVKKEGEEDELGDLSSLAEGLLSMTQKSSVEEERKRLQKLLNKYEKSKRKQKEREMVAQMRPPREEDDREGEHPIQTLNDLADWHKQRIAAVEAAEKERKGEEEAEKAEKEEGEKEERREQEDVETAQERLSSQLEKMLIKLKERVVDVDKEIGEKLHLLKPDATGLFDDEELEQAMKRLQKVDEKQVKRLVNRMKELAKERKKNREGREEEETGAVRLVRLAQEEEEDLELTVDDIKALAKQVKEEQEEGEKEDESEEKQVEEASKVVKGKKK